MSPPNSNNGVVELVGVDAVYLGDVKVAVGGEPVGDSVEELCDGEAELRREDFWRSVRQKASMPGRDARDVQYTVSDDKTARLLRITEETLGLPYYMAVRVNLRIKHVHRGILLGTGPLIDPGYDQPILIPLHNLTDQDYFIGLDEGLIWVEFTKAYPAPCDPLWSAPALPESTVKKTFEEYFPPLCRQWFSVLFTDE